LIAIPVSFVADLGLTIFSLLGCNRKIARTQITHDVIPLATGVLVRLGWSYSAYGSTHSSREMGQRS